MLKSLFYACTLFLFSAIVFISFSSCSEDDANLQSCSEYKDSIEIVFARNFFIGNYFCSDGCNIAPANQNYIMTLSADPGNGLGFIVDNIGQLSENGGILEDFIVKGAIWGSYTVFGFPNQIEIPLQTFYTNNSDTITIRGEASFYEEQLTFQYFLGRGALLPEKVCITNGIKLTD